VASHNNESTESGDNIMIAGLAFQVLTLLIFIICCTDFALRTHRRYRQLGAAAFDQDVAAQKLRGSLLFKGFLAALTIATIGIFWRSVYRVAELSRGWDGPLMYKQNLFIGFEGVMVVVACLVLNVFHPSLCFRELMDGKGGIGSGRKQKQSNVNGGRWWQRGRGKREVVQAQEGKSEQVSDVEGQTL